MFRLEVLQHQWVMLMLFSGTAVVLATCLAYMMIWRPRKDSAQAVAESGYEGISAVRWYVSFMPWILTLVFGGVFVFAIVYAVISVKRPPNW
jgi:uncharacterized Tic20 family protein